MDNFIGYLGATLIIGGTAALVFAMSYAGGLFLLH